MWTGVIRRNMTPVSDGKWAMEKYSWVFVMKTTEMLISGLAPQNMSSAECPLKYSVQPKPHSSCFCAYTLWNRNPFQMFMWSSVTKARHYKQDQWEKSDIYFLCPTWAWSRVLGHTETSAHRPRRFSVQDRWSVGTHALTRATLSQHSTRCACLWTVGGHQRACAMWKHWSKAQQWMDVWF